LETEIIFVEGGSTDDTFEQIQRVPAGSSRPIRILRQTGKGKGNAVREGFSATKGDVLMILDADLTTLPKIFRNSMRLLPRDPRILQMAFVLSIPMEPKAMRFLNMCANKFFSIAFDLLFGAAKLNLKITDISVRYRERKYGETNIRRWSQGAPLLKMLGFASTRMKFL
jgi:glycosyltransferase involved in cell wall biosynthesis